MAKRTFAIIGLGRFGSAMATTLAELGHEVIGIDADEEPVGRLADRLTQAVTLDATDARALTSAGIQDADVAVVSIGENVEASVLVTMLVIDLGIPTVVAKAVTPLHGRILERLGVTRVVFPDRDMAVRLAHSLDVPNAIDFIGLSRDFSIVEVPAPPEFVGQSLKELALRPRYGLLLIAIKRRDGAGTERTVIAPAAEERIEAGDVLSLLGANDRLANLERILGR